MARPLRIEYDGAWYHVINRGQERRKTFLQESDYLSFLSLLKEISEIYFIEIHAFSLMPNHYHLLVHTPQAGLSLPMKYLNGVYTQLFNKKHKRDGALFRGRYKAIIVDTYDYLTELVRYIHQNPVKAHMCNKAEQHRWTSHQYYLKDIKNYEWLKTHAILNEYGRQIINARHQFDLMVKRNQPDDIVAEIETHKNCIIGNDAFKEWVNNNYIDKSKREDTEFTRKEKDLKSEITAKKILSNIAFCYDVKVSQLREGKSGIKNEARTLAIYLLRQKKGYGFKEIAKWMNVQNPNAIAQRLFKFKQRLKQNKQFAKKMNELERAVMR